MARRFDARTATPRATSAISGLASAASVVVSSAAHIPFGDDDAAVTVENKNMCALHIFE
jgi:hypothetical protein